MSLQIKIEDNLTDAITRFMEDELPAARQELVNEIAADVLSQTAEANPVATGRSRNAWLSAAQQLSGGGNKEGEGSLTSSHENQTTLITATNHVPYVAYLEYGTSKAAPVSMLRQALTSVIGRIGGMFHLRK